MRPSLPPTPIASPMLSKRRLTPEVKRPSIAAAGKPGTTGVLAIPANEPQRLARASGSGRTIALNRPIIPEEEIGPRS